MKIKHWIAAAALVAAPAGTAQAALIDAEYSWTGAGGHSAVISFTYDDAFAIVSAEDVGPTTGLESLSVTFYDPGMTMLGAFTNVTGGVSSYGFLFFAFDTVAGAFVPDSFFDVGADTGTPGEYYLYGEVGQYSVLVDVGDDEHTEIDGDDDLVLSPVSDVPVPAAGWLLASGVLVAAGLRRRAG